MTPIASKADFDKEFMQDYSEAQVLNLMASVTKSCGQLQTLIDDFNFYQVHIKGN
jgi:hypothetical protein